MSRLLLRAVVLRLFASGKRPHRLLRVRCVGFFCALVGIALAVYAAVPAGGLIVLRYPQGVQLSLVCISIFSLLTLGFILFNAAQRTFAARLAWLDFWPLGGRVRRCLHLFAHVPLALLLSTIAVASVMHFFQGALGVLAYSLVGLSVLLTLCFNVLLRIGDARLTRFPQLIAGGTLAIALFVLVQLMRSPQQTVWPIAAVIFTGCVAGVVAYLFCRPVRIVGDHCQKSVREHALSGVITALCLRAIRTRRYVMANVLVVVVFGCLSGLSMYNKTAVPFDAAAALTLLLAGTLAQEVRSLSAQRPLEALQYGLIGRWVAAGAILLFINMAVLIDVVAACAHWLLAENTGTSMTYMLCIGTMLAAAGFLASAAIAPRRHDIFAQLIATIAYGVLAWLAIRLLAKFDTVPSITLFAVTAGCTAACLALSYAVEKWRWLTGIRSSHRIAYFRQMSMVPAILAKRR